MGVNVTGRFRERLRADRDGTDGAREPAQEDPRGRAESTIRGALAGPYARTLLLYYAGMSPALGFCCGLYLWMPAGFPLTMLVWSVLFVAILMACLAWLPISTTAVFITVGQSGVLVVQRILPPGRRSGVLIPWSGIGPRVVFSGYAGRVSIRTRNPGGVITLTLNQAKAILRDPRCPHCELPPKLSRRFEQM